MESHAFFDVALDPLKDPSSDKDGLSAYLLIFASRVFAHWGDVPHPKKAEDILRLATHLYGHPNEALSRLSPIQAYADYLIRRYSDPGLSKSRFFLKRAIDKAQGQEEAVDLTAIPDNPLLSVFQSLHAKKADLDDSLGFWASLALLSRLIAKATRDGSLLFLDGDICLRKIQGVWDQTAFSSYLDIRFLRNQAQTQFYREKDEGRYDYRLISQQLGIIISA